ncbi:Holliday junction branch migration protein RuvA [Donghicola eburneus]|uniref:Holliday junction branch migration complex subunit RuvA n=1 Tax=Donghicola eburneus TaxID=393278 RepID=A0A1M4MZ65_9RHOB|nr:Holliday junction branch migration protein RuvA [Donghicola eburneus]SCM67078.1 Holliday junction ATP-dependent DNA helicase RuvA [Donghicola eburneus]SFQ72206.1 Holliday junction DNA helicase subunit RuvA [Donghicola eburneus]
MIGKLSGRIDYRTEDHVLLDVRGVGYIVYCSDRTLGALPSVGEATALFTELLVREDLLQLYGFTTLQEKEWFRLLQTVQGVGAKAALAMLSALGPDGVSRAIALGDWNSIKAAKGIGPKTAQRVVNELKEKAPTVMAMGGSITAAMGEEPAELTETPEPKTPTKRAAPAPKPNMAAQSEALSALGNLGYQPGEAASAVAQAMQDDPEADTSALIRAALRLLAPKG